MSRTLTNQPRRISPAFWPVAVVTIGALIFIIGAELLKLGLGINDHVPQSLHQIDPSTMHITKGADGITTPVPVTNSQHLASLELPDPDNLPTSYWENNTTHEVSVYSFSSPQGDDLSAIGGLLIAIGIAGPFIVIQILGPR